MTGIFTTQIFVVQSHESPHTNLSFFALGIPLSSVCQAAALVNVIAGAFRFWRHQAAMTSGKACSGGWEVLLIGGLVTLVSTIQIGATCVIDRNLEQLVLTFFILILINDADQHEA
jgi:hypothetical protein